MKMARRKFDVFNLAFLDVMACGLGAIILFFMIISAQVTVRSNEANVELLSETNKLEEEVLDGRKNLIRVRNTVERKQNEQEITEGDARRLQKELEELMAELAQYEDDSLAEDDSVEKLRSDIERLEVAKKRLSAKSTDQSSDTGSRIRTYVGEGSRQYLTGMKMGGSRVLILVDTSTSMLARTYVNVVRFRYMQDEKKRRAPKWQQAIDTVDWLTTRIQPGTKFQVYGFNEEAASVIDGSDGDWIDVTDGSELERAVDSLRTLTPGNGTSLFRAFRAIAEMDPLPDNVYLLTDGLPTQGKNPPSQPEMVKSEGRIKLFSQAAKELPSKVPVNVLLFPMDGDPAAAGLFWQLALATRGSFLTPSRDWP
jgi:hypothetical protein